MTGSALFDFLIACVALVGAIYLFYYAIDDMSPNETFTKIAKVAIGVAAAVAFILACKAVLFGGTGLVVSPLGIIFFAIGIIVVLVVLYVVKLLVGKFLPAELAEPVLFIIGALCLIALLYLAATTLFGIGANLNIAPKGGLLR